jgi:hypothetical protein
MINLRKVIGSYDSDYPTLDSTTSHYEFLSYLECCNSLSVKPSITRFVRYNRYYRSVVENVQQTD